jgi:hypothetical protein
MTPSPTATFATALPTTATQPVETFEPQESEGPPLVITQTATLAPLPVVTYQVSQLTPSPELLILAHQPGSPDLPKGLAILEKTGALVADPGPAGCLVDPGVVVHPGTALFLTREHDSLHS